MKLKFKKSHLSIKSFSDVELPSFALITGLNGSGKTHLLNAIAQDAIAVDVCPNPSQQCKLFDWTNLIPQDTGVIDPHQLQQARSTYFHNYQVARQPIFAKMASAAKVVGLSVEYQNRPILMLSLSKEKFAELRPSGDVEAAWSSLQNSIETLTTEFLTKRFSSHAASLKKFAEVLERSPLSFEQDEMISGYMPNWGAANAFQNALGNLFVEYRDKWLANQTRLLARSKGRDVFALTEEEFESAFNVPPWVFANGAFKEIGLNFEINHPDEFSFASYHPRLRKLASGAEINFSSLSSGEKILMSMALCLYQASDKRQSVSFPPLVLFDEVDAPLHPSMSRQYLRVITDVLVGQDKVNVIATTHSPSTVALAPEASLFVMKSDPPRLEKITKEVALNILTDGVPTLAITHHGRRQVFVESPADAKVYGALYQTLKARFPYETSLEFMSTGIKTNSTGVDTNTGCDLVTRLVRRMREVGVTSCFGLIDWDAKNLASEGLLILAPGRRHSLENVMLDPLLLSALIIREFPERRQGFGTANFSYAEFLRSDVATLQSCVDRCAHIVFGSLKEQEEVSYLGGFSLNVDNRFLRFQGHALSEYASKSVPELRKFSSHAGDLMCHIVNTVVADNPDYTPLDIADVFSDILARANH